MGSKLAESPHADIAGQIRALNVPHGHLTIWALGQQGYLLKGADKVVVIDPYLSNYVEETSPPGGLERMVPIVVQPGDLDMVDLILSTHAHADHCDPRTLKPLMQASPNAMLLTSYKARDMLAAQGFDMERIQVPTIGESGQYGVNLSITSIPSAHYEQEPDEHGNPAYLGFIVTLNGVTLYHCGDTIVYPGMIERLKQHEIDIACLPINGRDWFREQQDLVGNLDYREAAELCAAINAKVLLPGHNDMFAGNSINPSYLLDYLHTRHPRQRAHFLQAGELYYYVR